MFFLKFLVFAFGFLLGLMILKYLTRIVYTLGKNEWAETKLGPGGTYTVWRFIGLGVMVISFLIALFM